MSLNPFALPHGNSGGGYISMLSTYHIPCSRRRCRTLNFHTNFVILRIQVYSQPIILRMYFRCYFCFSVPYAQALILQFAKSCFYLPMYVSAHNAHPSHPICDIDTTYVECGYVYYVTTGKWSAG